MFHWSWNVGIADQCQTANIQIYKTHAKIRVQNNKFVSWFQSVYSFVKESWFKYEISMFIINNSYEGALLFISTINCVVFLYTRGFRIFERIVDCYSIVNKRCDSSCIRVNSIEYKECYSNIITIIFNCNKVLYHSNDGRGDNVR